MPITALRMLDRSLNSENSQGCRDKDNYADVTINVEKGDIDFAQIIGSHQEVFVRQ